MTMDSLFQVFAGDQNQIWWLLPIHLAVSNCCRWFRNIFLPLPAVAYQYHVVEAFYTSSGGSSTLKKAGLL